MEDLIEEECLASQSRRYRRRPENLAYIYWQWDLIRKSILEEEPQVGLQELRWIKMDQIFDEESRVQYDHYELKETGQMEEKVVGEDEKPVEEGVMTRGQLAGKAKEERKSADQDISEGKDVRLRRGSLRKMPRNRRWIRRR